MKGVKISIKNVGIEPAYDLNWTINIVGYGSGFLNLTKKGSSSLPLQIGDEKKLRFLPFGRSVIDISITANASNAFESKKSADGLIFIFFIIVLYL
ncbi:MAG: hypothetical protein JSW60_00250 [Thermoplasmatales archaeon]|nr:MAG: hypothetical protein JSW60_00250 [Thermoplasmatales archaeon]